MLISKKIAVCLAAALVVSMTGVEGKDTVKKQKRAGYTFTWSRTQMNGSRTGVSSPCAEDVTEALGRVEGKVYYAPSGKVFKGGCVTDAARIVIGAQPAMADVKEVVGYATRDMVRTYPECELSNLFADTIMDAVEAATGKKVDIGIANFGGIRVDLAKGDILKDDIMSMFPFKNDIVYVALKGKDIRAILEQMAATKFQVLGGVRVVARDGKIVSAEIGGEPLDDEKVYGVATITFLLDGGDDLYVAKNAVEVVDCPIEIYDVMIDYVKKETAAGRPIEYRKDGRVQIL